jgi:hypothetical protein
MDIDQLRYFLKDEYTYEETTKEIFLNEIESIFEAHRNSGDTELLLYPGVCNGKTCENCGKKGYRFVGNNSKNYMDLIFEIDGDDIIDIYSCGEFKSNSEIPDLGILASIYINADDRASFLKTPSYWARVYAAQDAYNELVTTPPRKLSFDEMKYWMDKHVDLYNRLHGDNIFSPPMRWSPFLMCYYNLKEIVPFVSENQDEIRQANQLFKEITGEKELIDWVLKYETVYEKGTIDLLFMVVEDGDEIYFKRPDQYMFSGELFTEAMKFMVSFLNNNTQLLEKYSIFNQDEESELYSPKNKDLDTDEINTLSFHLVRRQEFENMGVKIPFYVNAINNFNYFGIPSRICLNKCKNNRL